MNYKIGDIVHEKKIPKSARTNRYIFLGIDNNAHAAKNAREMCGDIDIGMFVAKPIDLCNSSDRTFVRVILKNVELFEI